MVSPNESLQATALVLMFIGTLLFFGGFLTILRNEVVPRFGWLALVALFAGLLMVGFGAGILWLTYQPISHGLADIPLYLYRSIDASLSYQTQNTR